MTKNSRAFYSVPYVLWLGLFVISPMLLILYQSFFDITGAFTFSNYATYFSFGKLFADDLEFVPLCVHHHTRYVPGQLSDRVVPESDEAQATLAVPDHSADLDQSAC